MNWDVKWKVLCRELKLNYVYNFKELAGIVTQYNSIPGGGFIGGAPPTCKAGFIPSQTQYRARSHISNLKFQIQ